MLFLTSIFDLKYLWPHTNYQKLVGRFCAIKMRIIIYWLSSSKTVGGDRGDRWTDRQTFFTNSSPIEKSKLPPHSTCFAWEG